MTLIEIMVVIAMIGGVMVLAGLILFPGDEAKLKDHATRLVGSIKYVYNEAAIKNKYYRFVFDLDAGAYHVESSSEPFILSTEPEKQEEPDPDSEEGTPPSFAQESNYLIKPVRLPEGIKIKDISVLHLPQRQESGTVHSYFLPNGWAEPTVINLSDEDEEYFYSLEVNPLTGKAQVREEYYQVDPESLKAGGQ